MTGKGRGGGICLYIRDDLEFIIPSNAVSAKIEHYGIKGSCLKWFRSYLTDRRQYTENGNY